MALLLQTSMCRLCLQSDSEPSTVSIFSIANGHVIAEIVQRCLSITIVKDCSPYENICSPCIVSLVSMYELYLKYQECNRSFMKLCSELPMKDPRIGSETVINVDGHGMSATSTSLEDLIEEDYSIDDETEELEVSSNTALSKASSTDANFDEPVCCLQDFGGYVRQPGEMEGLLHVNLGHHHQQHTDDAEWNHPNGPLNKSLMEELNAQVARLDGQEITNSKTTASTDSMHSSPVSQPAEMYTPLKTCCQAEGEKLTNPSKAPVDSGPSASDKETDCYEDPKHHCYICETSFPNDIDLVNHFPAHFLDVPQDCGLCGIQHRTVMNLNRHMAYHQPGRPYKCTNCERRFANPQTYKWHISEFHSRQQNRRALKVEGIDENPPSLVCDVCGKLYMLAEPYEQHVQQHEHGHQQYVCKLCDRAFSRNIYLLFHLETHAKKRPHHCQYCAIPFASLYLKNFHEKRHPSGDAGPVSRRCPLCLTVCRAKHRLLAHIEAFHPADTRIQLLQCSFNDCRLKFLDLNEFQSHITEHRVGDRLPCTYCARVFKRPRLLNTHLRTVHGLVMEENGTNSRQPGPTYQCKGCSKTFRTQRNFRLHIEKFHDNSIEQETK